MRDLPDIETLLALSAGAGDEALAARCRAIAAREREFGLTPYETLAAELRAACGGGDPREILARLAADIRRGRFDAPGPEQEKLVRLLWRLTLQKLRENNPGFELDAA